MTEAIFTLIIATGILLGSPGPATLSLAAVGATYGVSRGLPYLTGILLGLFCGMAGAVFGVAAIFTRWPDARSFVQLLGAAYLFYVSYRIATAPVLAAGETEQVNIPSLRDGFILNLLNPKAYAAFFVLFSQFLVPLENVQAQYIVTSLVICLVAVIVDSIWLIIGSGIRSIFTHSRSARLVRVLFALSIVIATLWTLFTSR
jgi:threonine/homoserine/homoserine lactone efflux protein